MNMQCGLIQEFMLYEFELDHNAAEATQNISSAKGEGTINLDGLRKFAWVKRTWMIWQVALK